MTTPTPIRAAEDQLAESCLRVLVLLDRFAPAIAARERQPSTITIRKPTLPPQPRAN